MPPCATFVRLFSVISKKNRETTDSYRLTNSALQWWYWRLSRVQCCKLSGKNLHVFAKNKFKTQDWLQSSIAVRKQNKLTSKYRISKHDLIMQKLLLSWFFKLIKMASELNLDCMEAILKFLTPKDWILVSEGKHLDSRHLG